MTRLAFVAGFLLVLPLTAFAKPAHKQALAAHMGPYLLARVNDCRLCHLPGETDPHVDKPRNAFGERLESVRNELKKAGKPFDIPARFDALANEDSDGDGVTNLVEVLTGHFPGDAKDTPSADEKQTAEKTVAKYKRFLASYPWRPFEPVKRPAVPKVGEGWAANPIDAFIAEGHREHDLTPRPDANPTTLLRRVYFDLIGLPPTPAQLQAFEVDHSQDAFEKVVNALLASPRYGERWGRHWMDVWRYSDWAGWTGGNDIRDSQPHVWRWRDWIVESLNADLGYDRMIHEMLAGDEITATDPKILRATGYLARNFKASREKWMTDVVDHTFLAFQGLTIGCARCHDHLYDPIKQSEYYQVRAIFEPHKIRIDQIGSEKDTVKDGLARAFDADLKAVTYLYQRGDERNPDKSKPMLPGVPGMLNVSFPDPKAIQTATAASTGRRLAFAHWLTDTKNPLTARVAVNHIWMRHFGQPLVPSVFDFGKNGRRPMNPALLDWLAVELVEHKWSMKHLHKLIVTSRTYRQGSTPDAKNLVADRDNDYFWRMPPHRLEAEAIRDQLLFVAGKLDLTTGGPDLDQNSGLTVYRRSLYFRHAHEKQMELLKLFDGPGVSECYQRRESIVPQQALALVNSPLSAEMALRIAQQIETDGNTNSEMFVSAAFERVIGRAATVAERQECLAFLDVKPIVPKAADSNKTDGKPYELSSRFKVTADATVIMLRFLKAPSETGTHRGKLWDADGKLLTEVEFTGTSDGWQSANLKTPVKLDAGTMYAVSVNCNTHYPFAKLTDLPAGNGQPLKLESGRYGPPGKAPSDNYGGVYFVDAVVQAEKVGPVGLFDSPGPAVSRRAGLILALFNHHEFVTVR